MIMKPFNLFVLSAVLLLTACGPSENLIRHAPQGPDFSTEGVIVYSFQGEGRGTLFGVGTYNSGLVLVLQQEGSQLHTYPHSLRGKHNAAQLKAGTYKVSFLSDQFVVAREPLSELPYNKEYDIPIRPFTINPGEVVYLGDLLAKGIHYEKYVAGVDPSVTYSVGENVEAAKDALNDKFPTLVNQMIVRKLEIDE